MLLSNLDSNCLMRWFLMTSALLLLSVGSSRPAHGQRKIDSQGRFIEESATIRINFPNSPVAAILPYYEKLTGARIVQDANLTGVNLSISSGPRHGARVRFSVAVVK